MLEGPSQSRQRATVFAGSRVLGSAGHTVERLRIGQVVHHHRRDRHAEPATDGAADDQSLRVRPALDVARGFAFDTGPDLSSECGCASGPHLLQHELGVVEVDGLLRASLDRLDDLGLRDGGGNPCGR